MEKLRKTIWIINQYASTPESGLASRHYYLAKGLANQGHRVYLIAASYTHLLRNPPELEGTFRIEVVDGFSVVWTKVPRYRNAHDKRRIGNWFYFSWRLLNLPNIIMDKPDVVMVSSPAPFVFLAAQRLAKISNAKLVFEVRDIWPLSLIEIGGYSPNNPFMRLMQWVEDKAYRDADLVLSNLPNALEHVTSRGGRTDNFSWIPNGLDMNEVSNPEPLSEKSLGELPRDKFVVGYAGTLGEANALEVFIEAASLVKDNDVLAWVLVGAGKKKKSLQASCEKLGLNNVYFINPISRVQVQSMLAQFDVCYIGWKNVPIYRFGVAANKLAEYLYSRTPIVHSFSGHGDPVNKASAGLTVPAEDAKAIVDAVLKIKSMSPKQRGELGRNGREWALKNYDYARLSEKLAKVLLG